MRRVNGEAVKRQVPREQWPPEAHEPPITHPWWTGLCLEAFCDLSTERDCSWSLGPIPWTAIHAWGQARGLRGETLRTFERLIRAMDDAYMPIEGERLKREAEAAKGARHG
jgi:hypothetical protein